MRRAPAGGYDFGNKRQYRRDIWGTFVEVLNGPLAHAHYVIMPSLEGAEIDEAVKRGVRPGNLHCVDENPGIVASLKRRYPEIKTYGVGIERAVARVSASGVVLQGANLDLTGSVDDMLYLTLRQTVDAGQWVDQSHIAVTALRGRESSFWTEIHTEVGRNACARTGETRQQVYDQFFRRVHGGKPTDIDLGRIIFMQQAISGGEWVCRPRWSMIYKSSNNQTMLVSLFLVRPRDAVERLMRTPEGYQRWCCWWDKWIEIEPDGTPRKRAPSDPEFAQRLREMFQGP